MLQDRRSKLAAWLKAVRFQFYPMTWIVYTLGALEGARGSGGFSFSLYWIGYAALFFLEFAAVLSNEIFDLPTDSLNRNFGPFTGGSRVLVTGELSISEVRQGAFLALLTALLWVAFLLGGTLRTVQAAVVFAVLTGMALGYTIPPLRLVYRGLGELTVAATHSFGVMVSGYIFQGGNGSDPFVWIAGAPVFLAVFSAIILAGLPDLEADRSVSKKTLAVLLGRPGAVKVSQWCLGLTLLVAWGLNLQASWEGMFGKAIWFATLHGLVLMLMLQRYLRRGCPAGRIDALLGLSLSFILWFSLVPLIRLLASS